MSMMQNTGGGQSGGDKPVNLHQYFKMRTRDKKLSLDNNGLYSYNAASPQLPRDGLVMSNMINQKREPHKFETISEIDEHRSLQDGDDANQIFHSKTEISLSRSDQVYDRGNNNDMNSANSRSRLINSKKQSVELRTMHSDMFNDIKSNSGASQYSPEIQSKLRRPQRNSLIRVSRSLDSLFSKSNNPKTLIASDASRSYFKNFFRKDNTNSQNSNISSPSSRIYEDQGISSIQFKKRKASSSVDEILWKRKHRSLVSQLEDLPHRRWALIKESSSLFFLTIKSKIAQIKAKRASCEESKLMPVIEMMSDYYSKQYMNCVKGQQSCNISNDIFNAGQNQIVPQFFTQETAAKYILKLYKNRNVLKKNYLEEIFRSKEGQIQFRECCLEGKCATGVNKNPHVNKIKCMNKYLLLYRAFQDEYFFNELVINTYDFLISNHELFTQMVCFFFFNDNVSFNRQYKCLEFCLKWIKKRPFTFSESQDLYFKMKEFISFIKLKYNCLVQEMQPQQEQEQQHSQLQLSPCKCDSYLRNPHGNNINNNQSMTTFINNNVYGSNNNNITTIINQTNINNTNSSMASITVQSPLKLLYANPYQHQYETRSLNIQQIGEKESLNSHNDINSLIGFNIGGGGITHRGDDVSQSYNTNSYNIGNNYNINSNLNSLSHTNMLINPENYDSTHVTLASRSEKRRGPPPALARYNNAPHSHTTKKLLSKIILNQNQGTEEQHDVENNRQTIKSQAQIQTIDSKTQSIPFIKESRGATSIYAGSQAATAYTFTNQGENVIYSQTESSGNINTYKSLFSERKESSESMMIHSLKAAQMKSLLNGQNFGVEDQQQVRSLPNKNAFSSANNLTSSAPHYEQYNSTQAENNYLNSASLMSKSLALPQKSASKMSIADGKPYRLAHKDSIQEEEILESQESSYISSLSSGGQGREKSQSVSQLTSTIQSISQNMNNNGSSSNSGSNKANSINNSQIKSIGNTSQIKSISNNSQIKSGVQVNVSMIKTQKKKQGGQSLTVSDTQLKEIVKMVKLIEAAINYRVVSANEQRNSIHSPSVFSCLSQEQVHHIQEKWEVAMQCRFYERLNTQILKQKFSFDIFSQFEIEIIAQQICLIDHTLYCNINIYEFFSDKRLKSFNLFTQHSQRKNLSLVKSRFNLFTYFIIFMILLQPTQGDIKFLYEKLLELSEKALEYQNYNLCLQIYSSFNSSIIYDKIKKVHEISSSQTKKRFSILEKSIEFNRSFHALKEAMHKAKPPLVPALNIITRDLTLLDQHKDDFIQIQNQPQLDLVKFEEISKLTQVLFTVKSHNYPFIIYPAVYDFFSQSYEKFMAQHIDMKDSSTIEFKLSEFARKNCPTNQ